MADEKIRTAFESVQKEMEEYEKTFGVYAFKFDTYSLNNNDVPTNALIEITLDDKTVRATIPIERLLEIATTMKSKIDEANYPRWLDERPAHMLSDGTLIRVEEVRFHPEHGMFATVVIFDRNMHPSTERIVEITGHTDRKALARKLTTHNEQEQEWEKQARLGYRIWRIGE